MKKKNIRFLCRPKLAAASVCMKYPPARGHKRERENSVREKKKTIFFLRNFSSFYCIGFWAISQHSENKGVKMRPFLPIVFTTGHAEKRVCNKRSRPISLSYVLPWTTGLTVNHRPTTTLSTISRPRNIARNFGGRSENRLYIGKASLAILWTISLLFAVSNVAVFSTGPAKHRLLSTLTP